MSSPTLIGHEIHLYSALQGGGVDSISEFYWILTASSRVYFVSTFRVTNKKGVVEKEPFRFLLDFDGFGLNMPFFDHSGRQTKKIQIYSSSGLGVLTLSLKRRN